MTLRKQTTLKNNEHETIVEKSGENLVSPLPLRAKISHVDMEQNSSGQKVDPTLSFGHSVTSGSKHIASR